MQRHDSYKFQVAHAHHDILIKALLRRYGGDLFIDFYPISEKEVAKLVQLPLHTVVQQLQALLHHLPVLHYSGQKEKPQ